MNKKDKNLSRHYLQKMI